jgi:hypothetical protein
MTLLFDPKCELHVYLNNIKYEIRDLDMDFNIELFAGSGKKSNPNLAEISIYNLNDESRSLFSEQHQAIEFYAGHEGDVGLIFQGQTTGVIHVKEPTGYRTDIFAGDGIRPFTTAKIKKSYKQGTLAIDVINDITSLFGLPVSIEADAFVDLNTEALLKGETYEGLAKEAMNSFCSDRKLDWSIQFGVVEVTNRDYPVLLDPTAIVMSADTGMIGSPEIIERTNDRPKDDTLKKGEEQNRVFGVKATMLLTPELKPKRLVQIISQNTNSSLGSKLIGAPPIDANGVYIADVVRYTGNNYGGEFYAEFEGDIRETSGV